MGADILTYDHANQPVAISGASTGSFVYDGNFRRVKQVIDGETIYSVYNLAGEMVYRRNTTSGEITDYLRMDGRVFARQWNSSTLNFVHSDHLGSPMAYTNQFGNLCGTVSATPRSASRNTAILATATRSASPAMWKTPRPASPICRPATTTPSSGGS